MKKAITIRQTIHLLQRNLEVVACENAKPGDIVLPKKQKKSAKLTLDNGTHIPKIELLGYMSLDVVGLFMIF